MNRSTALFGLPAMTFISPVTSAWRGDAGHLRHYAESSVVTTNRLTLE
jgi:hypothetical protein